MVRSVSSPLTCTPLKYALRRGALAPLAAQRRELLRATGLTAAAPHLISASPDPAACGAPKMTTAPAAAP